jgi:hypothetical protein
MRTTLFLVAGFLLLGASAIVGRLFSSNYPEAPLWATIAFLVVWLALTATNLWVGVNKAGYAFGEELPVLLILFGVPAVVAIVLKWKVL